MTHSPPTLKSHPRAVHPAVHGLLVALAVLGAGALGRLSSSSAEEALGLKQLLERNTQALGQLASRVANLEVRPTCDVSAREQGMGAPAAHGAMAEHAQQAPEPSEDEHDADAPSAERTEAQQGAFEAGVAMLDRARAARAWSHEDRLKLHTLAQHMHAADRDEVLRSVSMAVNRGELRIDALALAP